MSAKALSCTVGRGLGKQCRDVVVAWNVGPNGERSPICERHAHGIRFGKIAWFDGRPLRSADGMCPCCNGTGIAAARGAGQETATDA